MSAGAIVSSPAGLTSYPAANGDGDAGGFLIGPEGSGAPYQTLAAAVAAAGRLGTLAPRFYLMAGGDYSAAVTLPESSTLEGVSSVVGVVGNISTQGSPDDVVLVRNIAFAPASGVGLTADAAGSGGQGVLLFEHVRFIPQAGATGALISAYTVEGSHVGVNLDGATGLVLRAGNAVDERTEFGVQRLELLMESDADTGVSIIDGVGGDDRVSFIVDTVAVECNARGTAIQVGNTSVVSEDNGLKIGLVQWLGDATPGGIAFDFTAGAGNHVIGTFQGDSAGDTLVAFAGAVTGQVLTIGQLLFGITQQARNGFVMANLDGQCALAIHSGHVALGAAGVGLDIDATANPEVFIKNVTFDGGDGSQAQVVSSDGPINNFDIGFEGCTFELEGNVGDPKFDLVGDDNPPASGRQLAFTGCTIRSNGTDPVISLVNADLFLADTHVRQQSNAVDCVEFALSGGQSATLAWSGHCSIRQATGGAGRAIDLPNSANMAVGQAGLLEILECTPAEQFNLNGGTSQTLLRVVPDCPIAQGYLGAWTLNNFLVGYPGPAGVPSAYPGVYICTGFDVSYIETGGDDSGNAVTVTNQTTGASAAQTVGPDGGGGGGAQVGAAQTLPGAILVGPGQLVSVQVTTATTAITDAQVVLH